MIPQERRDSRSDRLQNNRPRRDFSGQFASVNAQAVNVVFREPVQKVLEKVGMSHFLNGQIKWQEIQSIVIKTCTAIIIKIMVILLKIVGTCGTI